jgi:hypothetical protein
MTMQKKKPQRRRRPNRQVDVPETAPIIEHTPPPAPEPVVETVAPMYEYVAPAPMVEYIAPAPVAPIYEIAAPTPVYEFASPQLASSYYTQYPGGSMMMPQTVMPSGGYTSGGVV